MTQEKKGIELSLEKMVVATYQKVANWHNEDTSQEGLKVVSHDIVESILDMAFEQLGTKTKSGIKEELLQKTVEEYNKRKQDVSSDNTENKEKNIFKKIF